MPITVKIFIGIQKNAKVAFHLKNNKLFEKEYLITEHDLKEVSHEGAQYLGMFLDSAAPLQQIDNAATLVQEKLEYYLGESLENYPPIVIFSQCFIGSPQHVVI